MSIRSCPEQDGLAVQALLACESVAPTAGSRRGLLRCATASAIATRNRFCAECPRQIGRLAATLSGGVPRAETFEKIPETCTMNCIVTQCDLRAAGKHVVFARRLASGAISSRRRKSAGANCGAPDWLELLASRCGPRLHLKS